MTIVCSFCHNHSTLVTNVYPTAPGEEGPKSSALSLLLFYATSKPHKLPKIGSFVEKRIVSDLKKYRYGHVKVSMEIINSLLNECKQSSGVISKQIQRSIILVLDCPEFDLILSATNTFVLYYSLKSRKDVMDVESKTLHQELVKRFCLAALDQSTDMARRNKARICGLKALGALCTGSFFDGSNIDEGMEPVLSALLANLSSKPQSQRFFLVNCSVEHPAMTKRASLADQLISEIHLSDEAERCFAGIFCNTNANSLRSLMNFLIERSLQGQAVGEKIGDLLQILKIMLANAPAQYHFVIISLILENINTEPRIDFKTAFVDCLVVLIENGKLTGVTIPELLDTCTNHLKSAILDASKSGSQELQVALVNAIGSLAINLSYPDQLNEIIAFLSNRGQFERQPIELETSEKLYLNALLRSITQVIKKYEHSREKNKRSSVPPSVLYYPLISPLLKYFQISDSNVRLSLFELVFGVLKFAHIDQRVNHDKETFFHVLQSMLLELVTGETSSLQDYLLSGMLLKESAILHTRADFANLCTLYSQGLQKASAKSKDSQKVVMNAVFLLFLAECTSFLGLKNLEEYSLKIGAEVKEKNPWLGDSIVFGDEAFQVVFKDSSSIEKAVFEPLDSEKLASMWNEFGAIQEEEEPPAISVSIPSSPPKPAVGASPLIERVAKRAHQKKPSTPTEAAKVEKSVLGINDFKDAIKLQPNTMPIIEQGTEETNSLAPVDDLLKSITAAYGTQGLKQEEQTDNELDWLKSRSRQISNQSGISLSQKLPVTASQMLPAKIKEPTIFDVDDQ